MTRDELLRLAFETGNLEYQIEDYQLPVYRALWKAIENPSVLKYVCNISRRFGKTHISSVIAVELAIRKPGAQINYSCTTDKQMKKILRTIYPVILKDCPPDLMPKRANGVWEFPNGSVIYTLGVNNGHADDARGTSSDLNIVDEAGQIDELQYLVKSILIPQQLTVNGTMLLLSTPATEVDHDYSTIYHECLEEGHVSEFTILDNAKVMANPELYEAYVKEAGGEDSTTWQREYLCKFVTETNKIVIPEWALVKDKCQINFEPDRYLPFYLKYAGMDIGFRDNTSIIFGYADFKRQKLVLQDEITLNGTDVTSEAIAAAVKDTESKLWGAEAPKSLRRISDNNNPILLNDIQRKHGILFHGTSKDELQAMISQTRLFIGAGKLEVHERCKYLLGCLEFAVWNKNRDAFAQSKKYGHYDGLAALVYLLRYVDLNTNPVPLGLDLNSQDMLMPIVERPLSASAQGMKNWAKRPGPRQRVS